MTKQPPEELEMPDYSQDEQQGGLVITGAGLSEGLGGTIRMVLNMECRTKKTHAADDVFIPACFDAESGLFTDAMELRSPGGTKLLEYDVRGKLTISLPTPDGIKVVGHWPAVLVRQQLECKEPGKARTTYRFELLIDAEQLADIGVSLFKTVLVGFEHSQPELDIKKLGPRATPLEN